MDAANKRSDALEQYYLARAWREKLPLKAFAVHSDPRASVALSSVRAAGSKPARTKWPRQLSDVASEVWTDALPSHKLTFWRHKLPSFLFSANYRLARASFAAVRAAMSSYSSMPRSSFLTCTLLVSRKTLPGASPASSSSDSLLSSASPSDAA